MKLDLSDLERLAREYRQRAENLKARPMGNDTSAVGFAVRALFSDVLNDSENLTLSAQKRHYQATNRGWYGMDSGGHDMAKVNAQERIDPSQPIEGTGRFFRDSFVNVNPSSRGATIDLATNARMQPYPNIKGGRVDRKTGFMNPAKVTYSLPEMPIMYYFRRGWKDPLNPKHHMKPRPIGDRIAKAGAASSVIGRFIGPILKSSGFKQR